MTHLICLFSEDIGESTYLSGTKSRVLVRSVRFHGTDRRVINQTYHDSPLILVLITFHQHEAWS